MDAPVGFPAEEAGDAGLLFAPHHVESIPARAARGNRCADISTGQTTSASIDSRGCSTLLSCRCFCSTANFVLPFRVLISKQRGGKSG